MPKYDVYPNPAGEGFLLDVQTDLLSDLNTRVVVPLLPRSKAPRPASRLNPIFNVSGAEAVMMTQFMAAVPLGLLKQPVDNLSEEFEGVTIAVDMLMQGF